MARSTSTNAFRSLATTLLAPLVLSGTALATSIPDTEAKVCRPPALESNASHSFDLHRLKADLTLRMTYSGIPQPVAFIIDGEIPDPTDPTRHITHPHEGSYTPIPPTIIGISASGENRANLSRGIFGGACRNYLDEHFAAFQHYAAIHETAHHIDETLRLTEGIIARLQSPPALFSIAAILTAPMPDAATLTTTVREHIADTTASLYELTLGHTQLVDAIANWRNASLDPQHYSGPTLAAAKANFAPSVFLIPDLRASTEQAAALVESRIQTILQEEARIAFARQELGVPEGLDFDLSRPTSNPYIQNAQTARARLCRLPPTTPTPH